LQRQIAAEAAQRKHKEDELMLNDPETVAILKVQVQVSCSLAKFLK
jgi:urease gamma subunit